MSTTYGKLTEGGYNNTVDIAIDAGGVVAQSKPAKGEGKSSAAKKTAAAKKVVAKKKTQAAKPVLSSTKITEVAAAQAQQNASPQEDAPGSVGKYRRVIG